MADRSTGARADMMGSRADMISKKIDEVSRNQIWRNHLKKEEKLEGPLTEFHFNPHTLNTVALKPTQIDPLSTDKKIDTKFSEIERLIAHSSKTPQEKYEFSSTEAQEIGWLHDQARKNGREKLTRNLNNGKGSCDVTKFADAYCTMSGCSPFADKSSLIYERGRCFFSVSTCASALSSAAMYNNNVCLYSTKHLARCLTTVEDHDKNQFLIGTSSVRQDNEIHLLQYYEEQNELRCSFIFSHPGEIFDMKPNLQDTSLVFTSYNSGKGQQGTLWRMQGTSIEKDSNKLDPLISLPIENMDLKRVIWNPSSEINEIAVAYNQYIKLFTIENANKDYKETTKIKLSKENSREINGMAWDPHNPQLLSMTLEDGIWGYDIRSSKETFNLTHAHAQCVRDIDYNPNKPYQLCSGGDDCYIRFWDYRKPKIPLKSIKDHSHWVWRVQYNRYHDQLVLSSSSDGLVNLWRMSSISSAPLLEYDETNVNSEVEDIKIRSYTEHEDSVYGLTWGACDSWIFASLSYDGRVAINHVPSTEKYKILL